MALSDAKDSLSIKSFLFFTKPSAEMMGLFLKDDLLFATATQILQKRPPSICSLSRLACILMQTLAVYPYISAETAAFLFSLFSFCEDSSIEDLFVKVCSEPEFKAVQESLRDSKFSTFLCSELQSQTSTDFTCSSIKIMTTCASNPILRPGFCTPESVKVIVSFLSSEDFRIIDSCWECASHLLSEATCIQLDPLIDQAIVVLNSFNRGACGSRVYAIEFLTSFMVISPASLKRPMEGGLYQIILRLVVQFCESSNLMGPAFRFILEALKEKMYRKATVEFFIPVIGSLAASKERNAASANCIDILAKLIEISMGDQEMHGALASCEVYQESVGGFMKRHLSILNADYGGPVENSFNPNGFSPSL